MRNKWRIILVIASISFGLTRILMARLLVLPRRIALGWTTRTVALEVLGSGYQLPKHGDFDFIMTTRVAEVGTYSLKICPKNQ